MADIGGGLLISKHNEMEIQSAVWVQKGKPEAANRLNNIKMIKTLIKKGIFSGKQFPLNYLTSPWAATVAILFQVDGGRLSFKFQPKNYVFRSDPTLCFEQTTPLWLSSRRFKEPLLLKQRTGWVGTTLAV